MIQGVLFCRFLCIMLFFLIFHSIFDGFSYQISWGKTIVFFTLACFFSTWRPSQNIVFYRSGATFSFFKLLHLGEKTCTKNDSKIRCRKNIEKLAQLEPKITQKSIKIEMDAPEILKKWQKNYFFDAPEKHQKKRVGKSSKISPYDLLLMPTQFE